MNTRFCRAILALLLLSSVPLLRAGEVSIELPLETATYKPVRGVELAQAFCVQCHSVEYTAVQPPMAEKFWDAEVKKMRDKYGAPVPTEMDAKLVEYLTAAYGTITAAPAK